MKLLIVDDHPLFREGLKQVVSQIEAIENVAEADTGEAALVYLQHSHPDVIMLDLAMPGMDGLEFLEKINESWTDVRVIIVTSYDDHAYIDRAFELGARGYVLKDSAISDVIGCISAINEGGIYVSPSLGRNKPLVPAVDGDATSLLKMLTPTERIVLSYVAKFMTSKEIARELDMSYRTVQNHRSHICQKLNLKGSHQLISFASEHHGLIELTT